MCLFVFLPDRGRIFFFNYFVYLFWLCGIFMAASAFSGCGEPGPLSGCGVWTSQCSVSFAVEHRL